MVSNAGEQFGPPANRGSTMVNVNRNCAMRDVVHMLTTVVLPEIMMLTRVKLAEEAMVCFPMIRLSGREFSKSVICKALWLLLEECKLPGTGVGFTVFAMARL